MKNTGQKVVLRDHNSRNNSYTKQTIVSMISILPRIHNIAVYQALNHWNNGYNCIDDWVIDHFPAMMIINFEENSGKKYDVMITNVRAHCHIRFNKFTGSNVAITSGFVFIKEIHNTQSIIPTHVVLDLMIIGASFATCSVSIKIHFVINVTLDKFCDFRVRIWIKL